MLETVIKYWNDWVLEAKFKERSGYSQIKPDKSIAQVFIGVRRSGKTSLSIVNACQFETNFCYVNFEDPFFINNNSFEILDQIAGTYQKIYKTKPRLLILDEIQNIPYWERWLRKVIDTEAIKIFITGSSADLLSSEIATSLTGRAIEHTIWPLSFQEFLDFQKIKSKDYKKSFQKYIQEGGFPKINLEKTNQIQLLQNYLKDIIYKDIMSRYEIRNLAGLESVIQFILTNISSKHSANSIKNAFNINTHTVQEYLDYCESAFLLFFIKKYDRNLKIQSRNPQKAYCIDTGLRQANAFYHSLDTGKLVENIVFLELKRRGYELFYHQGNYEVDFLITQSGVVTQAINVCYSDLNNQETYDRELNGILECIKEHGLSEGTILTDSLNTEIWLDNRKIIFKPVIKFLLSKSRC
jgi:predicted AAA+ superfamily ATPase